MNRMQHLANPFDAIVYQPHVVPPAVAKALTMMVREGAEEFMNQTRLDAAKGNLISARATFHARRASGLNTAIDQKLLYMALDRVTETQAMASVSF
jgi:hypothetical protein